MRIRNLCAQAGTPLDNETMSIHEQTFMRLQNELVHGLASLFVFVEYPQVETTNNRSKRIVRKEATVRLLDEISRWTVDGISRFHTELDALKLAYAPPTP